MPLFHVVACGLKKHQERLYNMVVADGSAGLVSSEVVICKAVFESMVVWEINYRSSELLGGRGTML